VRRWRRSPPPLGPCTRTPRCPTTSTRPSAISSPRSHARIPGPHGRSRRGCPRRLFAELSADEQLEALKSIEDSDFFELVRATALVEIYSDERTWQLCGYEGPSFDKGGYINRGFNDLDWLPDPEEAP
jgi:hypothetical protein